MRPSKSRQRPVSTSSASLVDREGVGGGEGGQPRRGGLFGDARVEDGLEARGSGGRIGEHDGAQALAVDGAGRVEDLWPGGRHVGVGGAAGGDDLAGQLVGVDDGDAAGGEHVGHGRLPGSYSPGEAEHSRRLAGRPRATASNATLDGRAVHDPRGGGRRLHRRSPRSGGVTAGRRAGDRDRRAVERRQIDVAQPAGRAKGAGPNFQDPGADAGVGGGDVLAPLRAGRAAGRASACRPAGVRVCAGVAHRARHGLAAADRGLHAAAPVAGAVRSSFWLSTPAAGWRSRSASSTSGWGRRTGRSRWC